jgi:hypothetical protein
MYKWTSFKEFYLVKFIGYPKEKYIADQIQDLGEIIPDLSKQQIHVSF